MVDAAAGGAGRMNQQRIAKTWDDFEKDEPDISTERLIVMTAKACRVTEELVLDAVFGNEPVCSRQEIDLPPGIMV